MSRSNVKTVLSIASVLVLAPFVLNGAAERPAVVTVLVWTGAGVPERATGTVIAPGKVLTVAHVLAGAERVEVVGAGVAGGGEGAGGAGAGGDARGRADARTRGREATVLRRDDALDLAVLGVPGAAGPPVRFGDADGELRVLTAPRRGGEAHVAAAGRTGGVVEARLRRPINARLVDQPGKPRRPSFELAADIVSGDSGAPVVDSDGEIVGVVYARSTRRGGTAYAVRVLVAPR